MTATRGQIMGRRLPGHQERDLLRAELEGVENRVRELSQNTHMKRHERASLALHAEGLRGVLEQM